jgi:hypothetical protein
MKRFLIFTVLFPPLALIVFSAPDVIMHHDFRMLDLVTFGLAYSVVIIPAWLLAAVDWKFHSFGGTTIAGAAIAYLAAFSIGFPFLDYRSILMIGLIGKTHNIRFLARDRRQEPSLQRTMPGQSGKPSFRRFSAMRSRATFENTIACLIFETVRSG